MQSDKLFKFLFAAQLTLAGISLGVGGTITYLIIRALIKYIES